MSSTRTLALLASLTALSALAPVMPAASAMPDAEAETDRPAVPGPIGEALIVLDLLNEERRRAGIEPLRWHPVLADLARTHARDIRDVGIASHHSTNDNADFTERLERTELPVRRWAENVALDVGPFEAHLGLMRSESHRRNILDPQLTDVGIGVAHDHDGISRFIVQDFASVVRPLSPDAAAATVVEAIEAAPRDAWRERLVEVERLSREARRLAVRTAEVDGSRIVERPLTDHDLTYFYTSLDPEQLPTTLLEIVGGAGEYGVGVAFRQTQTRPQGTYFVVVVMREFA